MFLFAALTAASLLSTPVGLSGGPVVYPVHETDEHCTTPEMVSKVFTEHKLTVDKLEGDKLAAFNQAYEAKLHQPAPSGIAVLLLVEQGGKTQVLSFNQANCLVAVGTAPTEVVQQLLGN